jgi:hypothetical protein
MYLRHYVKHGLNSCEIKVVMSYYIADVSRMCLDPRLMCVCV